MQFLTRSAGEATGIFDKKNPNIVPNTEIHAGPVALAHQIVVGVRPDIDKMLRKSRTFWCGLSKIWALRV